MTCVAIVDLVCAFIAREDNLFRIDHDNMIAGVDMGCEISAVFATQTFGDVRRQPARHDAFRVNDDPLVLYVNRCVIGFHRSSGSLSFRSFK